MAVAVKSEKLFTYGDYLQWGEDESWELIDGVAYNMSPAPSRKHQEIVAKIFHAIYGFLEGNQCKVYLAPFDVRLPEKNESDEEIGTVVQPDISVFCETSKLDERGARGAPDFIAEILSPHTAQRDLTTKFELYERHGVREYWIVHPNDKIVQVFLLNEQGKYNTARVYTSTDVVSVPALPGLEIDFSFLDAV